MIPDVDTDEEDEGRNTQKQKKKTEEKDRLKRHAALFPGKQHAVVYMALRNKDNLITGINGPKAPKNARYTATNHIDRRDKDSYAIYTSTITRTCLRRAHQEAQSKRSKDEINQPAIIIAIRTALVKGAMQDCLYCSDQGSLARAYIGKEAEAGVKAL